MLKSIILPIAAFGVGAALTTAAAAQPVGGIVVRPRLPTAEVKSEAVFYGDLDANSPDGARTLFHRIRVAARDVCQPTPPAIQNLAERRDYEDYARCRLNSIEDAIAGVNSPALDRYVDSVRYR